MKVGIDIGYNYVKAVRKGSMVAFPSIVGTYRAGTYSLADRVRPIVIGGKQWLVGDAALEQSAYSSGQRADDWATTGEFWDILLCEAFRLLTPASARAQLVTGLPIKDYEQHAANVKSRLMGDLTFEAMRKQTITIDQVLVVTQSYGALCAHALNQSGQVAAGTPWTGNVGVADIGGNTVNLLVADNLRENPQFTAGDGLGLLSALGQIGGLIHADYPGLNPKAHEVSQWVVDGTFPYHGTDHNIEPYSEPVLSPIVDMLLARIAETWREPGRMGAVLITGGGGELLGPALKERMGDEYPPVTIGSRWDNACGYLKLANRVFVK